MRRFSACIQTCGWKRVEIHTALWFGLINMYNERLWIMCGLMVSFQCTRSLLLLQWSRWWTLKDSLEIERDRLIEHEWSDVMNEDKWLQIKVIYCQSKLVVFRSLQNVVGRFVFFIRSDFVEVFFLSLCLAFYKQNESHGMCLNCRQQNSY